MKYLKTFESYSVNENQGEHVTDLPPDVKENIEKKVQEEAAKLTPEQMEEAKVQLEDFAAKHGLTFDELKNNPEKLAAILAKTDLPELPTNEGIKETFMKIKEKLGGFLIKLGLVGFASTIIGAATATAVVGEAAMRNPEVGGPIGMAVGAAFAVSMLCYIIGASVPGEGRQMAKDIGRNASNARR